MAKPRRRPAPKRGSAAAAKAGSRQAPKPGRPQTRAAQPERKPVTAGSALRTAVAERSRGVVVWLSRLPPFVVPVVMVALMLAGLLAPLAFAVLALLAIVGFISWLAFLSWPVLVTGQRSMRVVAIGLVLLVAVARLIGWL